MKTSILQLSHIREKTYHSLETPDDLIIEGILQNSNQIIAEVYHQNFTKIKKMIWTFKNMTLEPEDIFQEGFTRAILNIRAGRFRGESSFATYLNGICRNICLKQLSKKGFSQPELYPEQNEEENHFEKLKILLQVKEQLNEKCKNIIDLRFSLNESGDTGEPDKCLSFDEIADRLQLSAVNARQRFKRCLDKLRELISSSPDLSECFD
jgi:RNA polymerase sigma factor (sigma-70 family)